MFVQKQRANLRTRVLTKNGHLFLGQVPFDFNCHHFDMASSCKALSPSGFLTGLGKMCCFFVGFGEELMVTFGGFLVFLVVFMAAFPVFL